MRQRLSLWISIALLGAVGVSCGDEKAPPQQAVIWLAFSTGTSGASCSSAQNFQFPDTASSTITGQSGSGDRVKDAGDDVVTCSLAPAATMGSYNVSMFYQNPVNQVGSLEFTGTLTEGQTVPLNIDLQAGAVNLSTRTPGQPCMAHVKRLNPDGAIWIDSLSCPNMVDARSPGTSCVGSGGLIFENCR